MSTEKTDRTISLVTIITPTHNRSRLLARLKDSLVDQQDHAFSWVVVDDGSTDGTSSLLARWGEEPLPFSYTYLLQRNGGKHRALNAAMEIVETPWVLVVDSDDWLPSNAVGTISGWVTPQITDPAVVGVAGLRLYPDGSPIGGRPSIPATSSFIECSNLQRRRHGLGGDKAEIYRTEVVRRYPFPTYDGETFLEEAVVGDAMAADGYRVRWYPVGIYYCEYQPDGLSARIDQHHMDSFRGYTYYVRQAATLYPRVARWALIGNYMDIARQKGISARVAASFIETPVVLAYALGTARRSLSRLRQVRSRLNFLHLHR